MLLPTFAPVPLVPGIPTAGTPGDGAPATAPGIVAGELLLSALAPALAPVVPAVGGAKTTSPVPAMLESLRPTIGSCGGCWVAAGLDCALHACRIQPPKTVHRSHLAIVDLLDFVDFVDFAIATTPGFTTAASNPGDASEAQRVGHRLDTDITTTSLRG